MKSLISDEDEHEDLKAKLWGSFLLFVRTFFPVITGREFLLSDPVGRESHFITVARELTSVARLQVPGLKIKMPPGYAKSTLVSMFVAWTMSRWPMSQFLYISYAHELASKHTEFIRRVMMCRHFQDLFDVKLKHDSKAKDFFQTTSGGSVKAFGSSGAITGQDAGLPGLNHFSGAVIIDDAHKPDEVHSENIRSGVIRNYQETILQRPRAPNIPIILIGQCLHEEDLMSYAGSEQDERTYKEIKLQALDDAGNALHPTVNPKEQLLEKKIKSPYVFYSQYQQEPIPAGGALYKEKDFAILDEDPVILKTFITADTAETSKTYNDATAFSFWGVYKLPTGQLALHWIDCVELRIEPKFLRSEFLSFYSECMRYKVKPLTAAIERKSTGVTLISVLEDIQGLQIRNIERTSSSKSKTQRFIDMQEIIAAKLVSFTARSKHLNLCINHMMKITANDSHRHDDIADTCYDACKLALMDKVFYIEDERQEKNILTELSQDFHRKMRSQTKSWSI